jgi:uncharacterized protein (TIGR02145 family)
METKRNILIPVICIIGICLSQCKTKEILIGEISGNVTDAQTTLPLQDAIVILTTLDDTITTGSNGQYLFKNLEAGNYDIQASKLAYERKTNKAAVTPSKTTEINFTLNGVPVPKISQRYLDFGIDSTIKIFSVSNIGKAAMHYSIIADQSWISVNPSSGEVGNETDILTVTINNAGFFNNTQIGSIRIISTIGEETTEDTISVFANGIMDNDHNYYFVVRIGTQVWMAENLNVGSIKLGGINQTEFPEINKYCYNNTDLNCKNYGGLYQWAEMMRGAQPDSANIGTTRGICPVGWHLPTVKEWNTLIDYLDVNVAAVKLKEEGLTHWLGPNRATNESGFTALPGGMWDGYIFDLLKSHAYFWTATTDPTQPAVPHKYGVQLDYTGEKAFFKDYSSGEAASVRCVKNP